MSEKTIDYWNRYYGEHQQVVPSVPSQFAAFVALELSREVTIVDLGCGSGRDSLFFADVGFTVLGVDSSSAAVDLCRRTSSERNISRAKFICCDVDNPKLTENILVETDGPLAVYARFFLHAIPEDAEIALLKNLESLKAVDCLAVEFRTNRDAELSKVTEHHYRRFISPLDFLSRARDFGFAPAYFVEGFGFAKYRNDDAHVARVLLMRS